MYLYIYIHTQLCICSIQDNQETRPRVEEGESPMEVAGDLS